ncbi:MAG: leucine-rich repeat domain-containing protein [Treponema sp.]|jgi:hypothetical protein|nr:leucine-rich repeat domain-containing protein [Treponema sp.]
MKKYFFAGGVCMALLLPVLSCAGGAQAKGGESASQNQGQGGTAAGVNSPAPFASYFKGDGGKGMSLAILVPDSRGLDKDHAYLPLMIQGCLVANISKYSAIKVLDRVTLDKVIAETLDPVYKDNIDIARLGHITQTEYIMTGNIIKTSYGYTLTINVTDTTPDPRTRAYTGNCTVSQLDDQTAIQLASKELLTQMGVVLSERAVSELSTTNQQSIKAQTVLAKGITAQRMGFEIEALSYYFQAAKFDPSLPEAANRSAVLAANISSGRIGDDLRNDVQWRKDWIARLAETEKYVKDYNDYYYKYYTDYYDNFYKEYNASWDSLVRQEDEILKKRGEFINSLPAPPYTLYYAVDMRNSGVIDYKNETTSFTGIKALLRGGSADWKKSVEEAVQSVIDSEGEMLKAEQGLRGKIEEVQRTVQAEQAAVEGAIRDVVQAVNEGLNATGRRVVWGVNTLDARLSNAQFNSSLLKTAKPDVPPVNKSGNVSFSVTVELVNSLNKVIGTNTFMTSCGYTITNTGARVSDDVRSAADFRNVNVNDITDKLTIRIASVNGMPAEGASKSGGLQIQAVDADEWGFEPWEYTIQNGRVTRYTGKGESVIIPRTIWGEAVASIGDNAFANTKLTSVTIGANVTLGSSAIGSDFELFYNRCGKLAGTYMRRDSSSSTWGFHRSEIEFTFDPLTGTITGYKGNPRHITIPETICRIPVTAIENGAFRLPEELRSFFFYRGLKTGDKIVVIEIGKGISFGNLAFEDYNFKKYYQQIGRKAGTYIHVVTERSALDYIKNPSYRHWKYYKPDK